ncbi:DUF4440 domain-containing protein [bacterium]|nr:DUF4440 domain-containing protein [bacterium]
MTSKTPGLLLGCLAIALIFVQGLPVSAQSSLKDEFAAQASQYEKLLQQKDAPGLAEQWTEDGMLITDDGTICRGRKEIEQYFKDTFSGITDAQPVHVEITAFQQVSPTVAVERGTTARGSNKPDRQYTAVHVKGKDGWNMAWVEEKSIEFSYTIDDLFWMIGTWKSETDGEEGITFKIDRIQNGKFIESTSGEKGGRQIIGYDPTINRLVAWHFDSRGGFGKGVWERRDNSWRQTAEGVLPDGTAFSAIYTVTALDKDSFLMESNSRYIGNIKLPNARTLKFVRVSNK